jgi:hypothetical protein
MTGELGTSVYAETTSPAKTERGFFAQIDHLRSAHAEQNSAAAVKEYANNLNQTLCIEKTKKKL